MRTTVIAPLAQTGTLDISKYKATERFLLMKSRNMKRNS